MKPLFIPLLLALSLSACGQKGDLFLKESKPAGGETEKPTPMPETQAATPGQ
ncbi:MAG: lipoprotein [Xanthomonadales bacterium]|nr:lipoprotein [Xanthomonadales bacterium]